MLHYRLYAPLLALVLFSATSVEGARSGSDIPGDGARPCSDFAPCPDLGYVGTVSSSPDGLLSGKLEAGASTLGISVGADPVFLTFSGGVDESGRLGPLGLNPRWTQNNLSMPISGNRITLDLTNTTQRILTDVAFFLQVPRTVVKSNFQPQEDGLSFGIYCTEFIDTCTASGTTYLALLEVPTGPPGSTLNPLDISPDGAETFGDLLRFSNVNLAPQQTGTFTFYITDYTSTRGGSGPPRGEFNLEIVPTLDRAVVPEPASFALGAIGILGLVLAKRFRRV